MILVWIVSVGWWGAGWCEAGWREGCWLRLMRWSGSVDWVLSMCGALFSLGVICSPKTTGETIFASGCECTHASVCVLMHLYLCVRARHGVCVILPSGWQRLNLCYRCVQCWHLCINIQYMPVFACMPIPECVCVCLRSDLCVFWFLSSPTTNV